LSVPWGQYAEAYKAIHDKLVEILVQLSVKIEDANQYTGTYAPTGAGSTTIVSSVSGKTIKIYDFYLWNSGTADVGVRLYFGASGKNVFKGKLAAKTGVIRSMVRHWESNADDSLVLYLDAAGTVDYGVGAVQS
jgi:hypothetical protein